jgi:hypothetical protein
MDTRIRIRIHPKMSWIRNTVTWGRYRYLIEQIDGNGRPFIEVLALGADEPGRPALHEQAAPVRCDPHQLPSKRSHPMEQKEKNIFKSESILERIQALHYMTQNNGCVRSLSVSFFIEKEPHKQLRMKRKRKGER